MQQSQIQAHAGTSYGRWYLGASEGVAEQTTMGTRTAHVPSTRKETMP